MNDRLLHFALLLTAGALPLMGLRARADTPRAQLVFRLCLALYIVVGAVGLLLLAREGAAG